MSIRLRHIHRKVVEHAIRMRQLRDKRTGCCRLNGIFMTETRLRRVHHAIVDLHRRELLVQVVTLAATSVSVYALVTVASAFPETALRRAGLAIAARLTSISVAATVLAAPVVCCLSLAPSPKKEALRQKMLRR
jgi:hypothetical protein